jgi:BlaI family transcriptional regulator, penicillinase repressor
MGRGKRPVVLTRLEMEVICPVWERHPDPVAVRDILDRINAGRKKPLAYNTVHTVLTLLKAKGVVAAQPGPGRTRLYRALLSRDAVATTLIGDLVDRLFGGRVQPLLHRLVEHESLGRDELEDLKQWIESRLEDEG